VSALAAYGGMSWSTARTAPVALSARAIVAALLAGFPTVPLRFDVLIIGSGLAGQAAALRLAPTRKVALVSKRTLEDSASSWAQGGIAAVLDNRDSIEAHIRDTITAGAFLNDPRATRFVIENGRRAVDWLIEQGVPFTRDRTATIWPARAVTAPGASSTSPTRPAWRFRAHLTSLIRQQPNITVLEQHIAIDLITGDKLGLRASAATVPMYWTAPAVRS
jgi:L-aspartate oxidase